MGRGRNRRFPCGRLRRRRWRGEHELHAFGAAGGAFENLGGVCAGGGQRWEVSLAVEDLAGGLHPVVGEDGLELGDDGAWTR